VNLEAYREQLERRLGKAHAISRMMIHKAQAKPKQVVFRRRERKDTARLPCLAGREDRTANFAGERGHDPGQRGGTGVGSYRSAHSRSGGVAAAGRLYPGIVPPAAAPRVTLTEARVLINNPIFRLADVAHGRRRLSGGRRHPAFPDTIRRRCRSCACARACTKFRAATRWLRAAEICTSWRIPVSTLSRPRKNWWRLRCAPRT